MLCNEAKELERFCYKNDIHLIWILKKLGIDRATFYRWRHDIQKPEQKSLRKLQKGVAFFEKLETFLDENVDNDG